MKFGLRLIEFLGKPRELVRLAVLGERAGFDAVWFPHDTFMHNTWALATATAEATRRVEIGGVGVSPWHANPCEIATCAATLDELSGGRARLGLGFHTTEFVNWTGIGTPDYVGHTREAVEIVRALFRGEVADYHGRHFRWNEQCYFRFRPLRSELPIYVCPFGEDYLRLSGEIGDGSLPMITPPASAAHMVDTIREGARRAGRDPRAVRISGCAWLSLSASPAGAAAKMRHMVAYFGPHLEEAALGAVGLSRERMLPLKQLVEKQDYAGAHAAVDAQMLRLGIVGTPREVIAEIERLAAAGIDEVNLGGPLGPDAAEAIELMGTHVIPYFR